MVDDVVRMHQAVVYEMKTAAAPEKHMANNKNERPSAGLQGEKRVSYPSTVSCCTNPTLPLSPLLMPLTHKFRFKFSAPQSSTTTEATMSTGMHNKLL